MTETVTETKPSMLPTAKTKGSGDPLKKPILIYGPYKVGKTTLAAEIDPDHTLFLATEPGQDAVEVFRVDIASWEGFRRLCGELAASIEAGTNEFRYVVIDTVDNLARFCADSVVTGLAAGAKGYHHASDFEYGKGWDAIASEFRLRIAKLCQLGLGVIFISHEKESPVKTNTGLELTALAPDVGQKGMRKFLLGYVDFIFHAEVIETADGPQHVLRTRKKVVGDVVEIDAGGRVARAGQALPELIPLEAAEFRGAMAALAGVVNDKKQEKKG